MGSAGTALRRYGTHNMDKFLDQMTRNTIGMDEYLSNVFNTFQETNYPPYNLIQVNQQESKLELALAGFKKEEINVYTEYGKLVVKGEKNNKEEETTYIVQGLAQRNFERTWALSDETEVRSVTFENGLLTVYLSKVVPDHHARKNWI